MKKSQSIAVQAIWMPMCISLVIPTVILFVPEPLWFGLLWEGWDALIGFVVSSTLSIFFLLYGFQIVRLRVINKTPALRFSIRSLFLAILVAASLIGVNMIPQNLPGGVHYGWPFEVFDSNFNLDLSSFALFTMLMLASNVSVFLGLPLLILAFGSPKVQFVEKSNGSVNLEKTKDN